MPALIKTGLTQSAEKAFADLWLQAKQFHRGGQYILHRIFVPPKL